MSEWQYLTYLQHLIDSGEYREGRNGGTFGKFGAQMRFRLSEGFPLLTTKKVFLHGIIVELLWFLKGDTNIKYLTDHNVHIWDEWADENGDLGPVYGSQWRSWINPHIINSNEFHTVDQITNLINNLKTDPYSRRHIVTAWNPSEVDDMALPPCHCLFQFHVSANNELSCHLYQRSADWFLGVPFNIASYALLTMLIARECGFKLGDFVHSFGDYHLYANHIDQAREQLRRCPKVDLPRMEIIAAPEVSIFDIKPDDFKLTNYHPYAAIKAPVSA